MNLLNFCFHFVLNEASNGQGSQTKKTKPKKKVGGLDSLIPLSHISFIILFFSEFEYFLAQKKVLSNELPTASATPEEQSSTLASKADVVLSPGKHGIVSSTEDDRMISDKSPTQVNERKPDDNDNTIPVLEIPSTDGLVVEAGKQIPDGMDTSAAVADVEVIAPTSKTELTNVNASDVHEENLLSTPNKEAVEINKEHQDEEQSNKLGSVETISKIDREMSESAPTEFQNNGESQTKDDSNKVQSPVNQKHQENTADKSSIKVQDQLEEV